MPGWWSERRPFGPGGCRRMGLLGPGGVGTGAAQATGGPAGTADTGAVDSSAARLRARWAATCERVAQRSEQNRRQQFDDVSRYTLPQRSSAHTPNRELPCSHSHTARPQTAPARYSELTAEPRPVTCMCQSDVSWPEM